MMEQHPQIHRFKWQGIEIEARYAPCEWGIIAHLEIESIAPPRAPLPVTQTGYKSHFHPCGTVEANGGDVVAQVRAWLDEAAASPEWRRYAEAARQGELFGKEEGRPLIGRGLIRPDPGTHPAVAPPP